MKLLYKKKWKAVLSMTIASMILVALSFVMSISNLRFGPVVYAGELTLSLADKNQPNSKSNPYLIKGVEDMFILQEFSKYNSCEGMYFSVSPELANDGSKLCYNPKSTSGGIDEDDEDDGTEGQGTFYSIDLVTPNDSLIENPDLFKKSQWYGIGLNIAYPFKGEIDFQGITLRTDTNLFGFIGEGAVVHDVRVFGDITSAKNVNYYNSSNVQLGAIASCAFIDDKEGIGNTINETTGRYNNSVYVYNCDVISDEYNTTRITNNTNYSTAGIIAVCVGRNLTYGSINEKYAVNFNVSTCNVNAIITGKGTWKEYSGYIFGQGSKDGVVKENGVPTVNPSNVKNNNYFTDFPGYSAGIIGDIQTVNSSYFVNVNIGGDNKVIGSITSKASGAGGVVGCAGKRQQVHFISSVEGGAKKGSISFADSDTNCLKVISSKGETPSITCNSGQFVANARYASLIIDADYTVIKSKYLSDFNNVERNISDVGNGLSTRGQNLYRGIDISSAAKIQGQGTADNPYILASANDFKIFARYLNTNGCFGASLFDSTKKSVLGLSTFEYIRTAYYRIENDIDISNSGINSIGNETGNCFIGKLFGKKKSDGTYPTITNNIKSNQDCTALFYYVMPYKGSEIVFKDFNLAGTMSSRGRCAGLIYQMDMRSYGSNNYGTAKFSNIKNSMDIKLDYNYNNNLASPFIAYLNLSNLYKKDATDANQKIMTSGGFDTESIDFNDLSYSGTIYPKGQIIGSLISKIDSSNYNQYGYYATININNYNLTGSIIGDNDVTNTVYSGLINTIGYSGYTNKFIFDDASKYGGVTDQNNTFFSGRLVVNIDGFTANGVNIQASNKGGQVGGLIGRDWNGSDITIKNVDVKNCNASFYEADYGGLISKLDSCKATVSDVSYDNYNIKQVYNNKNSVGGLFGYTAPNCYIIVDANTYSINNCSVERDYFYSDIVSYSVNNYNDGNRRYSSFTAFIDVLGSDANGKYSVTNPYIHKFSYINNNGTRYDDYTGYFPRGMFSYNIPTIDTATEKEKYTIKGSGTKDDPFIIDTEEKLVILSKLTQLMPNSWDLLFDYFADDTLKIKRWQANGTGEDIATQIQLICRRIALGYYVFADDMDLASLSFNGIEPQGGSYYGINARKYLIAEEGMSADSITYEDIKRVCVSAIEILEEDEKITKAYESAFTNSYKDLVAKGTSLYDPNGSDKATIEADIASDVKQKYYDLQKYKKYKSNFKFDIDSVQYSTKATKYTYCRPISNEGVNTNTMSFQAKYMQSALFTGISYCKGERKVAINNIKLEGSCGNPSENINTGSSGGILITRCLGYDAISYSDVSIRNIELGSIEFVESKATSSSMTRGCGLLIDSVNESIVDINGLTVLPGSIFSKADALIGYQYGSTSKTEFEHIDMNECVYADATLDMGLFYFNYDAGLGIYWYIDGDFEDKTLNADVITPGKQNKREARKVLDEEKIVTYAFKTCPVDINPATENIIHGKGTADDPFVIGTAGQYLSLYLMLKNLGETAGFDTWFVGETNGTAYYENDPETWTGDGIHNYVTWNTTDPVATRKSKIEYLRSAHYVIVNDIDLSSNTGIFKKCAKEFSGLGTREFPFSGTIDGGYVFDGETQKAIKTGGVTHKFTLSGDDTVNMYYMGMVRFANGVSISNMEIYSPKKDGKYTSYCMANNENSSFGAAIGCITGGDNIIDNVSFEGMIKSESSNSKMKIGGLVGWVKHGTLTFTNMPKDSVKNFYYEYKKVDKGVISWKNPTYDYSYAGGYVGEISTNALVWIDSDKLDGKASKLTTVTPEDREIFDDIYENSNNIYLLKPDRNMSNGYKFFVLNKSYFDDIENDKIIIDGNTIDGYVCHLKNEKQVYLWSLAISCGAFSVNRASTEVNDLTTSPQGTYYPYNYYSRTYKIDNDDCVCYNPMMLDKYFDITAVRGSKDSSNRLMTLEETGPGALITNKGYSMLCAYLREVQQYDTGIVRVSEEGNEYKTQSHRTTYLLENPDKDVYDFNTEKDFIGIGPREKINYRDYAYSFYGNFDGNGKLIKYNFVDEVNNHAVGFFNNIVDAAVQLVGERRYPFIIRNMSINGKISVVTNTDSNYYTTAGLLIGFFNTRQYWDIEDIHVYDSTIENKTENGYCYMGGLVACSSYSSNYNSTGEWINKSLKVTNCSVGADITKSSPTVSRMQYSVVLNQNKGTGVSGGVVGYAVQSDIHDCDVKNTYLGVSNTNASLQDTCGGIIGRYRNYGKYNYVENVSVTDSTITSYYGIVGGFIGTVIKDAACTNNIPTLSVDGVKLRDNSISLRYPEYNNNYAGKAVGRLEGGNEKHDIGIVGLDIQYSPSFKKSIPATVWNNIDSTSNPNKKSEYFVINQIKDIEAVEKRYGIVGGVSSKDETDSYRRYAELIATPATNLNGDKEFVFTDADGNPLDLIPSQYSNDDANDDYMLLEWNSEAGTMMQVINDLLDVLTDGTGILNNTTNKDATGNSASNITVEVIPMRVTKDGTVEEHEGPAAISVQKDPDGRISILSNGFYDSYAKYNQEGVYVPGTYSLIKVTYHVSEYASNLITNTDKKDLGYSRTIVIPFMVSNMINVESYRRCTLGEEYDENKLHNITNMSINITRDSSYTLYEEILYSKSRLAFVDEDVYYVKQFVLGDEQPVIPQGTKLTLVDATDDKTHTYYYEITESAVSSVRLTDFVDEDGNHYKERIISSEESLHTTPGKYSAMPLNTGNLGKKSRRGIEKFIVFVDMKDIKDKNVTSKVVGGVTQRESIWEPAIVDVGYFEDSYKAELESNTTKDIITSDVFHYIQKCKTELKTFDGRTIKFVDGTLFTEGTISKISTLKSTIKFSNTASDNYWNYIKSESEQGGIELLDYANKDKFIEVAISLVNESGERILLPAGTRVCYSDGVSFEPIKNTSNIYYFKESMPGGYSAMSLSKNTTQAVNIELDFTYAKMENLPAGNYKLLYELLRSDSVLYPMGSEVLDTKYSGDIVVTGSAEYGFSISDYDKSKLVFNKAMEDGSYSLDYSLKINSTFDTDIAKSKGVHIVYTLYAKKYNSVAGDTEYIKYVDSLDSQSGKAKLVMDTDSIAASGFDVIKLDENGLEIMVKEHIGQLRGKIDITNTSDNASISEQKIIISGIPGKTLDPQTGKNIMDEAISIPFKLTMPEDAKAVNYKLLAKLYASERSDIQEASDFVIFNISDINID